MSEKIQLLNPDPNKKGAVIDKAKYETVKDVILQVLNNKGTITFKELLKEVVVSLQHSFEGSPSWYCTAVKLDLEARGLLERIAKTSPQKIRLKSRG